MKLTTKSISNANGRKGIVITKYRFTMFLKCLSTCYKQYGLCYNTLAISLFWFDGGYTFED